MVTNNCIVLKGRALGYSPDGTMLKLSFVNNGQLAPKLKIGQMGRQHDKLISLHLPSLVNNICYINSSLYVEGVLFLLSFSKV